MSGRHTTRDEAMETAPSHRHRPAAERAVLLVARSARLASDVRSRLSDAGYAVEAVTDVAEALERIRSNAVRAAVVDTSYPDGSGFTVAAEIRKADATAPVLLVARQDAKEDMVFVSPAGRSPRRVAFDDLPVLAERLGMLVREAGDRPAATVRYGCLALDRVHRVITCRGVPLALTPTEHDLLAVLVSNAERPVPTETLLCEIRGGPEPGASNLLAVHVRNLRRKLEAIGHAKLIQTVRGTGYVLREP